MIKYKEIGKINIGFSTDEKVFGFVIGKDNLFNYTGIWIHLIFISFWRLYIEGE